MFAFQSGTNNNKSPVFGAYPIIANYFFGSPYSFQTTTETEKATQYRPVPISSREQGSSQARTEPILNPPQFSVPNFLMRQWSQIPQNYFQQNRNENSGQFFNAPTYEDFVREI